MIHSYRKGEDLKPFTKLWKIRVIIIPILEGGKGGEVIYILESLEKGGR